MIEKTNPNLTSIPTRSKLLLVRSANQCIEDAKSRPIPNMLFAEFWHEGELSILFADTNLGKSILAVQIADAITRGVSIPGFRLECVSQPVLYFDFELSDKQFEKRYSNNYTDHYCFSEKLYRIEINPDCVDEGDFEKLLFSSIEKAIDECDAKILIVDNLTYLKAQATETAKEALPLMKKLKELKLKHDLSILVLAHTPKRNASNPITKNDVAGSKHLSNFADSIFAIGESQEDKSLRYIKQIKARATEIVFDAENIMICQIAQKTNFLGFHFQNLGCEWDHLAQPSQNGTSEVDESILQLKKEEPGISNAEIARRLDINKMKVGRVLKRNNIN